jgi:hypothetical protein
VIGSGGSLAPASAAVADVEVREALAGVAGVAAGVAGVAEHAARHAPNNESAKELEGRDIAVSLQAKCSCGIASTSRM